MKDWKVYAHHVLDACDKLRRIRARGDPEIDDILYDAVLRNLQTLLESTARLPEDAKSQHDSIPWRQLTGMRNILVHDYLGEIDSAAVLDVVENRLDELENAVRSMLANEKS